ncbi:MAG: hypothetical protein SVX43_12990 [Cyanobacteriota bacterium]|nr:hypothetical protein [Cyanobacteriota bacterium]
MRILRNIAVPPSLASGVKLARYVHVLPGVGFWKKLATFFNTLSLKTGDRVPLRGFCSLFVESYRFVVELFGAPAGRYCFAIAFRPIRSASISTA